MQNHLNTVMNYIERNVPDDATIDGNILYIPDKDLTVTVTVVKAEKSDNGCMAVVYFWISHPFFGASLFETAAATGDTVEGAAEKATLSFFVGIFSLVLEYLEGEEDDRFFTEFFGEQKEWSATHSHIVLMGEHDHTDTYWDLIKDDIKHHLGNRPFYYVKVFAAKQDGGEITCECRVNDNVSKELGNNLLKYVEKWNNKTFCSQKQFFFIAQRSPHEKYPFSKEQVDNFVVKAVKVFEDCDTDEKYKNLMESLYKVTGDLPLAFELRNFMPEICAENYLDSLLYAETIILAKGENDEEKGSVYKDQFTTYSWVKSRIIDGFVNEEFSNEAYKKLITMSATFSVFMKAKKDNIDFKSFNVQTIMSVPADYQVR